VTRYDRPVTFAVDDDPSSLGHIITELERRYDRDYQNVYRISASEAMSELEAMRASGDRVALRSPTCARSHRRGIASPRIRAAPERQERLRRLGVCEQSIYLIRS
jgi:hypothetical protein